MSMLCDRPGRYKAIVNDWTLEETKNGNPKFVVEFSLTDIWNGQEWYDWKEYDQTIRGYFYPFKNDGSVNTHCTGRLMDVLGWDGQSLAALQSENHAGKPCQVTVEDEQYEGKTHRKVSWLNRVDSDPVATLRKLDIGAIKQLASKWDVKLRAVNGGKLLKQPPTPATRPAMPTAPVNPAPAAPATRKPLRNAPAEARSAAWEMFSSNALGAGMDHDAIAQAWRSRLSTLFPDRKEEQLTVADWKRFESESFADDIPVPGEPVPAMTFADAPEVDRKIPF